MPSSTPPSDEISKSERKRQMHSLQELGEALVALPYASLDKIPLEGALRTAIYEAKELKGHEALRRQMQYIGKLMRNEDVAPLQQALEKVQHKGNVSKAKFHQVEQWRDRLVAEGDKALESFLELFPDTETQEMRQLIRKAQKEKDAKNLGAMTALFRFLKKIIDG